MREKEAVVAILIYTKPNKQTKTKKKFSVWGELGFPVKFIYIYLEHRTQRLVERGKAKAKQSKAKRVVKNDSL